MMAVATGYRHGERIAALEKEREQLATKADLSAMEARVYKTMLVQTSAILGGIYLIVKFAGMP